MVTTVPLGLLTGGGEWNGWGKVNRGGEEMKRRKNK